MRSGGSNNTPQHIEDLSLCGLFLMEATKKIEQEFGAYSTSKHTVLDANKDITKLSNSLVEKRVVTEVEGRNLPPFKDPSTAGLDKLFTTKWIWDTLDKVDTEDMEKEDLESHGTLDPNYELHHVN